MNDAETEMDADLLNDIRLQIYALLETFSQGKSSKNGLYIAKFIPFFEKQLGIPVSQSFSISL